MHPKKRRIKLKINLDKVIELLKFLNIENCTINNNFERGISELIIEVEETPQLFKALSISPDIESWEFFENDSKSVSETPKEVKVEEPKQKLNYKIEDEEKIYFNNYNDGAIFIEAAWKLSKKSPSIVFGSKLFNEEIEKYYKEVANSDVTVEHALLTMILQSYYTQAHLLDFIEAHDDIIKKLKTEWKTLGQHPSLASLSNIWK